MKNKKNLIIAVVVIILLGGAGIGYIKYWEYKNTHRSVYDDFEPWHTSETKTVQLTEPTDEKKIIFKNDIAEVTVGYNDFMSNFEKNMNNFDEYKKSLQLYLQQESKNSNEISLENRGERERDEARYVITDLLEEGKGAVIFLKTGAWLSEIQIETWGFMGAPLAGGGGRTFKTPEGEVFLEVADWIS